ncbi:MAG: hypothetical protein LBH01_03515 [Verrucomicrobiales bacterium]|jgi:hypothetical protein|nr:hypothetical protein [Verrucomicrobiales bacterium]
MIPFSKINYLIRPTFLEPILGRLIRALALKQWNKKRIVPPPDQIKHAIIKNTASIFTNPLLIETGTFFGDTTYSVSDSFQKIYTIELSPFLAHS